MLHITLWLNLLKSFCDINKYLTYTTIACILRFGQSVKRSDSFYWQNTQEKDSSDTTAHESTKWLTLALRISYLKAYIIILNAQFFILASILVPFAWPPISLNHIIWIFDWHTTINSQCYKLHCGQVFYNHFGT